MIISHSKKFVLLAPWKTATSTTWARLAAYSESPYSNFYDFNPYLKRVVHQHLTYADFTALPESRLGYFTGSFIRNPYDRVYSAFEQVQTDLHEQPTVSFSQSWIREHVMEQLADNFRMLAKAGYDFDNWVALLEERQIFEAGRNTSFPLHPAHYWTHYGGQQAVDFIGRVEHFESDFQSLCARLTIDTVNLTNENVRSRPETADQRGYRHIGRMNSKSIGRINELFSADFDLFGYERL